MESKLTLLLLLICSLTAVHNLHMKTPAEHLQDETQAQIDALVAQQTQFEATFKKLLDNVTNVEKSVQATDSTDEKIQILENAIISERESVFELSKTIIPPFNVSRQSCEKMTDQQKVELLDELQKAREQVNQLKNISQTMPSCDELDQVKRDIDKELFFLDSIESIIYTNCSMNIVMSPTIWQTNIYAPNWILGNMTIDDLIEQYYQRSIRYDNVTNCHIDKPFFDGKQCIVCQDPTPVFDISQKKCTTCPQNQHVDNTQKQCVKDIFYTDFPNVVPPNYAPKDGPFPEVPVGATPCPPEKPYFDANNECINCTIPSYFNISTGQCMDCFEGQVFDENTQQCEVFQDAYLTKLSGTRWVSDQGVESVLTKRLAILKQNETSGIYKECPEATPYYDGVHCIACPDEFSLDTKVCVNATNGTAYDDNVHKYLPPTGPTNPYLNTTKPYLGQPPAADPKIPNCTAEAPFYDGVACIDCPKPFIIFDFATQKCVICDPKDIYNATNHTCDPRPIIYISSNEDNLMATPNVSIDDYHDNITQTIAQNPDAILVNCQDPKAYSNFKSCFTCQPTEYLNVETLECDICPGTINETTRQCELKSQLFTNLNATNIVNMQRPISEEQKLINDALALNNQSKICPIATPYSDGKQCFQCNKTLGLYFFDYTNKKCLGCPPGSFYSEQYNNSCVTSPIVNNISAINQSNHYIESPPNYTLKSLNATNQNLTASGIVTQECPAATPLADYTTSTCVALCSDPTLYYNIQTKICQPCPNYNQTTHTCPPPAQMYPNLTNPYWLVKNNDTLRVIEMRNSLQKLNNSKECGAGVEFYNNQSCVTCPNGTYFSYDDFQCYTCTSPYAFDINLHGCFLKSPNGTYQTSLSSPNLVYGGKPYNQWLDEYNQNKQTYPNIKDCPPQQPYYDGVTCIMCPSYLPYFNLNYKLCQVCPEGTTYNAVYHDCLNSSGQAYTNKPDLSKMYANIF